MIPQTNSDIDLIAFTEQEYPSYTFKLDMEQGRVSGYTDQQEAMKQAIYLILFTERYTYPIHSWNYGVELADLFGAPTTYALPEIKRRITEALLMDDRIESVDNWQFSVNRQKVHATFTAYTVFGEVDAEMEVNI